MPIAGRVKVCTVIAVLLGCSDSERLDEAETPQSSEREELAIHEHVAEPTPISEFVKELIVARIKDSPEVVDASLTQSGDSGTITLIVIVHPGTDADRARETCEMFVRTVMLYASDGVSDDEIGESVYRYVVSAYTPDETLVVEGVKPPAESGMMW